MNSMLNNTRDNHGNLREREIFPNGFISWRETHHEIVAMVVLKVERETAEYRGEKKGAESKAWHIAETEGTHGLWEYATELTNKFEKLHQGREWDGKFFDEVEEFFKKEDTIIAKPDPLLIGNGDELTWKIVAFSDVYNYWKGESAANNPIYNITIRGSRPPEGGYLMPETICRIKGVANRFNETTI